MIVVVVLATLMSVTFRLTGIGGASSARNTTVTRMQKLENCLSGYFAAFGSYPPVALHASRNVYLNADSSTGKQTGGVSGNLVWRNVEAACKAQPIAARFPFPKSMSDFVDKISQIYVERCNSSDARFKAYQTDAARAKYAAGFHSITSSSDVRGWNTESSWQEVSVFQFGLMSFLLPRYKYMLDFVRDTGGNYNDNDAKLDSCKQWTANNTLSANPIDGQAYSTWSEQFSGMRDSVILLIPSQAVTARWMPNLEGIVSCSGNKEFFGVRVSDGTGGSLQAGEAPSVEVYPGNTVLDHITVYDGWGREFYYYSVPPYQSYRLWSSGPNGYTFPPWVPLDSLNSDADRKTASNWMADDIMHLNN